MNAGRVVPPPGRAAQISICLVATPLGLLRAALWEAELVALALPADVHFEEGLRRRLPRAEVARPRALSIGAARTLAELSRQLGLYFAGRKKPFFLPLAPLGTPFQQRVWAQLQRIPYGERRTYAEVARLSAGRGLPAPWGVPAGPTPCPSPSPATAWSARAAGSAATAAASR